MTDDVPAGWYPDGQGGQRWWDGAQWTEHVRPAPPTTPPPPPPAPSSPPPATPPYQQPTQHAPQHAPQQHWQQASSYEAWRQPAPAFQHPPPAAGRRRGLVIGLVVVVLLLLGGGGLAAGLLLRDDSPSGGSGESSPQGGDGDGTDADSEAITAAQESVTTFFDGAQAGDCSVVDLLDPTLSATLGATQCAPRGAQIFFGTLGLERCELTLADAEVTEVVGGGDETPTTVSVGYAVTGCNDVTRQVEETIDVSLEDGAWLITQEPGFLL